MTEIEEHDHSKGDWDCQAKREGEESTGDGLSCHFGDILKQDLEVLVPGLNC